jgi:hypothetical protein
MSLPLNLPLPTMQTRWKSALDPLLVNPLNGISILKDVSLIDGTNIINHLLGKTMQGWFITDIQGIATIYRPSISPFNELTLTLISSAAVMCSIGVF